MPSDIGARLERAILEEDEKSLNRLRASHESARGAEQAFAPLIEKPQSGNFAYPVG